MPGLLRGVVRTAAIAGTATAVSNRVSRRQAEKWSQQGSGYVPGRVSYAEPPPEEQYAPAPAAPPPPDPIEQLKQLGALHEQGILTDEEFAAQKAKLLN
jgi:Short C-terminal domain